LISIDDVDVLHLLAEWSTQLERARPLLMPKHARQAGRTETFS
jgi:hypothetical protein